MTRRPVPARRPWVMSRARLVLTPAFSPSYQERISLTLGVTLIGVGSLPRRPDGGPQPTPAGARRPGAGSELRLVLPRVARVGGEVAHELGVERRPLRERL